MEQQRAGNSNSEHIGQGERVDHWYFYHQLYRYQSCGMQHQRNVFIHCVQRIHSSGNAPRPCDDMPWRGYNAERNIGRRHDLPMENKWREYTRSRCIELYNQYCRQLYRIDHHTERL
jgi:hypothetical protein